MDVNTPDSLKKRERGAIELPAKGKVEYIDSILGKKVQSAISQIGFMNRGDYVDEVFYEDEKSGDELRERFLLDELPLTRLDTRLLLDKLADSSTGIVNKKDFAKYIDEPELFAGPISSARGSEDDLGRDSPMPVRSNPMMNMPQATMSADQMVELAQYQA